ncbi:MAG: hypothetical protein K2N07_08830 [Desulfovibrio sp.]|nr:hypothetical protein [Desulfovibrio sp.]
MAGVYGNMMIPLKPRGGALPEYQGNGAPYVPGSGMGGRLSGEGARVAAAAVKVAAQADADRGAAVAGLAKAADHAVQVGLKAYGDYESAVAQNAFNHYQQEEMRLRAELNTLEGKNALGSEGVEARLARWRADARERLGTELGDIGHRMFSRAADKLDAQSDAWAVGKVNKENIAFQNTVSEGSILNARNLALENPGDEAALANAVGIIKAEYERMGARSGWDEGFRDAKFAEVRGKLVGDMISGALAGDQLGSAQTLLRRHGDELGPLKGQLEARIRAKGRELESRARTRQVNDFLTATAEMDPVEGLQLAEQQFAKDPIMRDAACSGIMHRAQMKAQREDFIARQQLKQMEGRMVEIVNTMSPAESYAELQKMQMELPLDKREAFWKIVNNLRNPGRHNDELAVLDVNDRLEAGEEFDIRAEYGSRLTPATVRKFESKAYKEALPSIMTTFDAKADEWLGVDENKEFAKRFGAGSRSALKALFLSQTDADEKKDAPRLRRELDEFFKNIALEKPGFFYNSDVETAQGLVPRVLDRHPGIRPKQGTPEYGEVTAALKAANIPPKGAWGSYTDKQLADGFQSLLAQKRRSAE